MSDLFEEKMSRLRVGGKTVEQKAVGEGSELADKFSAYYKDVSHIDSLDIYLFLRLFNVTDPAIAHAIKKLALAGARTGGKTVEKDVDEAIFSLLRYKELEKICPARRKEK